ncbi:SDR family NAD(P)-dependent oxidoreductase [Siphonobacter sp. SORGH_AS_1065]|uniref:SDR family NAD(P)-dependent oxidoreductase n=1 Tax=Siphonobacter sp. SORGH_AS_1065 TaxID=3041795 RepID=UPI00278B4243|nr:SDR family NAD(P)-dependent oxidoreductase [Siphonobacter sp. SORGH_AS_1065]MDQ1087047.1 nucleoside-diphosphate-sugar epimerase [Siphonobacter sp. SORGH_AS_1065]
MKISILGCGWLGLPLGAFLATKGYIVTGTTTTPEKIPALQEVRIQPVLLNFKPEIEGDLYALLDADVLIISIPPRAGKQGDAFHPQQIKYLLKSLTSFQGRIIYISSTSVYPDTNGIIDENGPVISDHPLVEVENLLQENPFPVTILRCGGLMGYDRIAGKYFIGKTVHTGDVPVNFVHRDDVIHIVESIMEQNSWGEVFNVVCPEHPIRRDVYEQNAKDHHWQPPVFEVPKEPLSFKIISSEKLQRILSYSFRFPNPVHFK